MNSNTIKNALRLRHKEEDGWLLLAEVRNGTGYSGQSERYVDAMAVHLWPSKKHRRIAYEIKVSRADFLKELDQPFKRQWAEEVAHEFWFVTTPGVTKIGEIPEGCGLLQVSENGKLRRIVAAKQRIPRDLDNGEWCAMMRRAADIKNQPLYNWAGKNLTETEFRAVIESSLDAEQRKIIEDRVQVKVEQITRGLREHAEALQKAGCEPPRFMLGRAERYTFFDADGWVEKNVSPGVSAVRIKYAVQQLNHLISSNKSVEQARDRLMDLLTEETP